MGTGVGYSSNWSVYFLYQTQIEVQKALAEDPTVYEYDIVYDQMQEKKKPQVVQTAEKDKKV